MILKNGLVMDPSFRLTQTDVEISGELISRIAPGLSGEACMNIRGCYLLPGFIDTHIHGAYGTRISDPEPDLPAMCRFEATQGVTSLAVTTASSPFENLLRQFRLIAAEAADPAHPGAKIAGIHAEGPFISAGKKGAMNAENLLLPDIGRLDALAEAGRGLLKIVTVAPELPGAIDLIRHAAGRGLTVSVGHTTADYAQTIAAFEAGASQLTHTFNAMSALNHRAPGAVGAGLTTPGVCCEMICDFVHLHPAVTRMIWMLKGAEQVNIISDSGHGAGLNVSEFTVDGVTRYVRDGVARLADGTIAGSIRTVLDGVRDLLSIGIPLSDVSRMASLNPARSLKLENEIGSIAVGKKADLVVLDADYNVLHTFIDGECVYSL